MFLSTVAILLFAPAFSSLLVTSFSSARTTPSLHLIPTAVPPFSTALTAYSTWESELGRSSRWTRETVPGSCGHRGRRRSWTGRNPCLWTSKQLLTWMMRKHGGGGADHGGGVVWGCMWPFAEIRRCTCSLSGIAIQAVECEVIWRAR